MNISTMPIVACRGGFSRGWFRRGGDIVFMITILILLVMQSLAYSMMYWYQAASCVLSTYLFTHGASTIFWFIDDGSPSKYNQNYRRYCIITCMLLFICNIYITHVHDSDVKSVVTRLAILIACHYVFILLMYFARNLYDALKWYLEDAYAKKLNILWVISYTYTLTTVIMMVITYIPFAISISSDFDDKVAIIFMCVISFMGYCLFGKAMVSWQAIDFVPIHKCTLSLMVIQITSIVTFVASNIIYMAIIIHYSLYHNIICIFTLSLIANIFLLVDMILIRDLCVGEL
jgi:hypothetical protein